MAIWKQLVLSVVVAVFAVVLAAELSPVAAGFLASHGLGAPMRLLGLTASTAPGDAAAPAGAGKGDAAASAGKGGAASGGGSGAAPGATADASGPGAKSGNRGQGRKATVVLQPAGTAIINDKITALGTGAALQAVTVLPKANGTLTEVDVASGALVTAGQVIARLDSNTQQIAHEKAILAADDAHRSVEHNKLLVQSNAAPANQTQAVELAANLADLAVRVADQDLADRVISAPIAGVLGIVKVSVGNAVTPQTQIVTIEDSSALVINFWLPERLAGQIKVGDAATLVPVSRPDVTLGAKISTVDNQIDPASGTFQVQAQVPNTDGSLRPGMSFTVTMGFAGDSYVTVNPLSVQWGSSGAYVWRVTENKVSKVPVRVVQRNTETVLVAGDLKEGDAIVTEGLDGLKDGADVQIFGAPPAAQAANGQTGGTQAPADASQTAAATPGAAQAATPQPGAAQTDAQGAAPPADGTQAGDGTAGQGTHKHKHQTTDAPTAGN